MDRSDGLMATITALADDVARLKALGASRWGNTLTRPTDLSSTTVQQYVQHDGAVFTTNASSNITVTFHANFPNACDGIVMTLANGGVAFAIFAVTALAVGSATVNVRNNAGAGVGNGIGVPAYWWAWGH